MGNAPGKVFKCDEPCKGGTIVTPPNSSNAGRKVALSGLNIGFHLPGALPLATMGSDPGGSVTL